MTIKYVFVTGETVYVDAPEDVGMFIKESRRAEHASNRRHSRHYAFLNEDCLSDMTNPEALHLAGVFEEERQALLSVLSALQKVRFEKFESGETIADIARSEGRTARDIRYSIRSAQKKLCNIYSFDA